MCDSGEVKVVKVGDLLMPHDKAKLCVIPPRLGEQICAVYQVTDWRDGQGRRIFTRSGFDERTSFPDEQELVFVRE